MNASYKNPFNPEWITYYIQLNQSLEHLKQACPSFLTEFEKTKLITKINKIQNLIYIQKQAIQKYDS